MGAAGPRPVVLDAGPLIAFDQGDGLARRLIQRAVAHGGAVIVPAAVVAQVWRDPRRQARLARLIASETTKVDVLDADAARAVGAICGRSRTSDVVDASVVLTARLHRAVVVTSDAGDLLRIDPSLEVHSL